MSTGKIAEVASAITKIVIIASGADAKVLSLDGGDEHDMENLRNPKGFTIQLFLNQNTMRTDKLFDTEVYGESVIAEELAEQLVEILGAETKVEVDTSGPDNTFKVMFR